MAVPDTGPMPWPMDDRAEALSGAPTMVAAVAEAVAVAVITTDDDGAGLIILWSGVVVSRCWG